MSAYDNKAKSTACEGTGPKSYPVSSSPAMNTASPTYEGRSRHERIDNGMWSLWKPIDAKSDGEAQEWVKSSSHHREWRKVAAPVGQGIAPTDAKKFAAHIAESDRAMADPLARVLAERCDCMSQCPKCRAPGAESGSATSGEAALEQALDAEYPIPDSPHASVLQHAAHNRIAFGRGYRAALAASAEQSNTSVPRVGSNTSVEDILKIVAENTDKRINLSNGDLDIYIAVVRAALARFAAPVAERAAAPASVPECHDCLGSGHIMVIEGSGPDTYEMPASCTRCDGTGAAAAPEVSQPAAQGESIDTPEFRDLLAACGFKLGGSIAERQAEERKLIAHVLEWGASQRQEGRIEGWDGAVKLYVSNPPLATPAPTATLSKQEIARLIEQHTGLTERRDEREFAELVRLVDAVLGAAPTAGEASAEPDELCNSALRAEPAAADLALRADFDAFMTSTQGIVTGEKWPSIEVKKAWMVWHACAEALAARSRAKGGMHDDDTPISMSTYGSLAECEAEQACRDAINTSARELYVDWVERQGIHSNRLPGWGELSADERASWVSEARLHIKATQGGKDQV